MSTQQLIPPRFLFRFAVPCLYRAKLDPTGGLKLPAKFELPAFAPLDDKRTFAEIRAAWNDDGLAFSVSVTGKKKPVTCQRHRPEHSDGFALWLDTRDTKNVHRAGRFCHQFLILPFGEGKKADRPCALQSHIHRARENAPLASPGCIQLHSAKQKGGYSLDLFIESAALNGYDPEDHARLGFTCAIQDQELGIQSFSCGPEFPFNHDPSLWATLELIRD